MSYIFQGVASYLTLSNKCIISVLLCRRGHENISSLLNTENLLHRMIMQLGFGRSCLLTHFFALILF